MPYEVTEVGWGEFYIGVKIFFVDESLEPVQLQHLLVVRSLLLSPTPLQLNAAEGSTSSSSTATNETYDEIIFNEPASWFYKHLVLSSGDTLPPHKFQEHFWDHSARDKETTCRYICCQSYFQVIRSRPPPYRIPSQNETYRLLAEASELSRQIQYLQEKANVIRNPTILAKGSTAKALAPMPKAACSTPTNQPTDSARPSVADSASSASFVTSSYDPRDRSPTLSAAADSTTSSVIAEERTQTDDRDMTDFVDAS
ncbi:gas41 homologue, putative [Babesia caballi]|uniref:Gas41 homologue, putative n=1 Tax=Babesia caballi TaxID=5871 RepID=A0AAV4LNE0_BABCB|nr:gas41 homologue, putative [Babesia caballi]